MRCSSYTDSTPTMVNMDVQAIARGIVSGMLADQIERRGKTLALVLAAISIVGLIAAVALSGWFRFFGVVAMLFFAGATVALLIARWGAVKMVHRIAEPQDLQEHRATIAAAIDDADLPTGPIAAIRFAWRMRGGVGDEVDRLRVIAERVSEHLDASD